MRETPQRSRESSSKWHRHVRGGDEKGQIADRDAHIHVCIQSAGSEQSAEHVLIAAWVCHISQRLNGGCVEGDGRREGEGKKGRTARCNAHHSCNHCKLVEIAGLVVHASKHHRNRFQTANRHLVLVVIAADSAHRYGRAHAQHSTQHSTAQVRFDRRRKQRSGWMMGGWVGGWVGGCSVLSI